MMALTLVDLNVGGIHYTVAKKTLISQADSLLHEYFSVEEPRLAKDNQGRYFLDRDGVLFRYVLDYLRNHQLILPENFQEKERLRNEAEHFRVNEMVKQLSTKAKLLPPLKTQTSVPSEGMKVSFPKDAPLTDRHGTITLGYRGTFAFGRDGLADVKFRKLSRLLVCGKVTVCRSVFGDTLNESRDPDRGDSERYTSRFFLKHTFLEQAFDMLIEAGFVLAGACGTGTNSMPQDNTQQVQSTAKGALIPSTDSEEGRWYHYNEFIWTRTNC